MANHLFVDSSSIAAAVPDPLKINKNDCRNLIWHALFVCIRSILPCATSVLYFANADFEINNATPNKRNGTQFKSAVVCKRELIVSLNFSISFF